MIELTIYNYLKAKGYPVYMEIPSSPPDEMVVIEKTGSSITNRINHAVVAIQSYSTSLYKTALLNDNMKADMLNISDSEDVGSCQLNSDYNAYDTTNKKYRYQAVFDLYY